MPLAGLHSWVGLLAGLHVQAGPLGDHLPVWVGLLVLLSSQVGPLAGFCNHLQLGKVPGCVRC